MTKQTQWKLVEDCAFDVYELVDSHLLSKKTAKQILGILDSYLDEFETYAKQTGIKMDHDNLFDFMTAHASTSKIYSFYFLNFAAFSLVHTRLVLGHYDNEDMFEKLYVRKVV